MIAYTNEIGLTSFIFADTNIHKVMENSFNYFGIGDTRTYSDVINALGDWYEKEENMKNFEKYNQELLAYLHSCLSIPLAKQMSLIAGDGYSSS